MDYKEKVIALLNSQELSKEQKEKLEDIFPELTESEDEMTRKELIAFLTYYHTEQTNSWIAWLEKVGNIIKEWGDVDKDILFRTIDSLKFLKDTISTDPNYAVNIIDIEREITWLKSLRPQNRWKPSESDIFLLERIANGESNPQDFQASLGGLIGQLKKLREE